MVVDMAAGAKPEMPKYEEKNERERERECMHLVAKSTSLCLNGRYAISILSERRI